MSPKQFPWRKALRYTLIALVSIAVLAAILVAVETCRSKWAWEKYRHELEASGVQFDLSAFTPPVPAKDNFAETPLFKPLFEGDEAARKQAEEALRNRLRLVPAREGMGRPRGGWMTGKKVDLASWGDYLGNADVLAALQKFEPELAEISEAAKRPACRFPLKREKGIITAVPHLEPMMDLASILRLRSFAELQAGQTDRALADVETLLRLDELTTDPPFLITALVRVSNLSLSLQPIWQGVASHRWSEAQLETLQQRLQAIDWLKGIYNALQGERAAGVLYLEAVAVNNGEFLPSACDESSVLGGWSGRIGKRIFCYQNLIAYNQAYENLLLPMVDPGQRRFHPDRAAEIVQFGTSRDPYRAMAAQSVSVLNSALVRFAAGQTYLDEAVIACALERHRLGHGSYPERLEALVPRYLASLPHDLMTGGPPKYRRTEGGGYLIYSVGWNGTDEGGEVVMKQPGACAVDVEKGDWVWKVPGV